MKKHPISVEGFDGTIEELAQQIFRMRYDKIAEFFEHAALEMERQSIRDGEIGRVRLANMSFSIIYRIMLLANSFRRVFEFCKPFMKKELEG